MVWPDGAGLASCMGRVAEIVYFFKFAAGALDFMRGGGNLKSNSEGVVR